MTLDTHIPVPPMWDTIKTSRNNTQVIIWQESYSWPNVEDLSVGDTFTYPVTSTPFKVEVMGRRGGRRWVGAVPE